MSTWLTALLVCATLSTDGHACVVTRMPSVDALDAVAELALEQLAACIATSGVHCERAEAELSILLCKQLIPLGRHHRQCPLIVASIIIGGTIAQCKI